MQSCSSVGVCLVLECFEDMTHTSPNSSLLTLELMLHLLSAISKRKAYWNVCLRAQHATVIISPGMCLYLLRGYNVIS